MTRSVRIAAKRRLVTLLCLALAGAACGEVSKNVGDGNPDDFFVGLQRLSEATYAVVAATDSVVQACGDAAPGPQCPDPLDATAQDGPTAQTGFRVDALDPPDDGATVQIHASGFDPTQTSVDLDLSFEDVVSGFGTDSERVIVVPELLGFGDTTPFTVDFHLAVRVGESDPSPDEVPLDGGTQTEIVIPGGQIVSLFFDLHAAVSSTTGGVDPFEATWVLSFTVFDADAHCHDDLDCPAGAPFCAPTQFGGGTFCDTGAVDAKCGNGSDCLDGLVCSSQSGRCVDPATNTFCAENYECAVGCSGGFCREGQVGSECDDDQDCVGGLVCSGAFVCEFP